MPSFITWNKSQSFPRAEHAFLPQFKIAAKRHVEVVISELVDIYFIFISHYNMIFNAEFISEAVSSF